MKLIIDIEPRYCKDMNSDIKPLYYEAISRIKEAVRNGIPYEERPTGEWVGNAFDEHHCKRCGHPALWEEEPDGYYEVQSRFCPTCGLPMDKGDTE